MQDEPKTPAEPRPEKKTYPIGLKTIMELFDVGPTVALTALSVAFVVILLAVAYFIHSKPPTEITIATGPEGSSPHRRASRYAKILEKNGVKLRILTSKGSRDNLARLMDPGSGVDVAFVQGGVQLENMEGLVSLGSLSYQPLMIFYRGKPIDLLTELKGRKIAVGPVGSGARTAALAVLAQAGIKGEGEPDPADKSIERRDREGSSRREEPKFTATLLDYEGERAAQALQGKEIDAAILMGESTPMTTLRALMREPSLNLYSFRQAAAYARRVDYLNPLELPEGGIDITLNLPPKDVTLLGPMVELIAVEKRLHPALSDLLLEAAVQIHGRPSMYHKKGDFPKAIEHAIPISEDAERYFRSGKSLLYRYLPFSLASLISRILVAFLPTLVVLIPVLRSIPAFFRWRANLRVRRHYRELLELEKNYLNEKDPARRDELRREFDQIEETVNRTKIRPAFADQFYGLRGHINYVRDLVAKKPGGAR